MRFSFGGGTYSLGQLLPMRFGPQDLLPDPATPLLLQPQDNGVQLTAGARDALRARGGDPVFARAAAEALKEAAGSYAPYSRCPAGVAIVTEGGDVYSGGYVSARLGLGLCCGRGRCRLGFVLPSRALSAAGRRAWLWASVACGVWFQSSSCSQPVCQLAPARFHPPPCPPSPWAARAD